MNRTDFSSVKQNSFRQSRLATVNVCRYTDVSDARAFIIAKESRGVTEFIDRPSYTR